MYRFNHNPSGCQKWRRNLYGSLPRPTSPNYTNHLSFCPHTHLSLLPVIGVNERKGFSLNVLTELFHLHPILIFPRSHTRTTRTKRVHFCC